MQMLIYSEIAAGYVLLLAVVVLFIRAYLRTRNVGFIWLAVASLIWPFLGGPTGSVLTRIAHGLPFQTTGQSAAAVHMSQQIISLALLMVAVFHLGNARAGRA